MTKKKRGHPDFEEILARPWCYYCERDFDDLKILINHQKAKHFKCERCGRRLNTAGGLSVHMSQVHKENLSAVDNALPNRAGLDIEIFGMEGIPEDILQQHTQRVLTTFHQTEAERRAATGNPAPGSAAGVTGQVKKPKFESPSDLKKRLAEHKAKLAAEQANGGSSGGGTPLGAGQGQPPSISQSPTGFAASPTYPPQQMPYSAPAGGALFGQPQAQPYAPPPAPAPSLQQPPAGYPQPSFSPPPFQNQPPYSNAPFLPHGLPNAPPPFQGPPLNGPPLSGPPRPYGVTSPVQPFPPQQQHIPPRNHTPPQPSSFPPRPPSLPPAPGLPQRPAFGAPQVNAFQMQQLHQGQIPPGLPNRDSFQRQDLPQNNFHSQQQQLPSTAQPAPGTQESNNATSLDDLISGASKRAAEQARAATSTPDAVATSAVATPPPQTVGEGSEEKSAVGKKEKDKDKAKALKLVYSDNQISPEEKMAQLPRYAFTPAQQAEVVV